MDGVALENDLGVVDRICGAIVEELQAIEYALLQDLRAGKPDWDDEEIVQRELAIRPILDASFSGLTELDRILPGMRIAAARLVRARLHPWFLQSPFVRRSFDRPLGYPGDYRLVEMVFDARSEGTTALARIISQYALQCGPSRAHRARAPWIASQLAMLAQRLGRPPRVLSYACGPARIETEYLRGGGDCEITLADFEERALAYALKKLRMARSDVRVRTAVSHANHLIKGLESVEGLRPFEAASYDAIVVAGLFDYLPASAAAALCKVLAEMGYAGGLFLVSNLHTGNPWRAFMEYVGRWECLHRSRDDVRAILEAGGLRALDVAVDDSQTNVFAVAQPV